MILIIGSSTDPVTMYFQEFLKYKKKSHLFFDQRCLGYSIFLHENHIMADGKKYDYDIFSGCYNRTCKINSYDDSNYFKQFKILHYVINHRLNNVVNKECDCHSNFSKLNQLSLVELDKIKLPESKAIAKTPLKKIFIYEDNLVFKSLSNIRSIVTKLNINKVPQYSDEPVLFQELIKGINIKVHVIADKTISVAIESEENIDYRYDKDNVLMINSRMPKIYEYDLNYYISQECINIARKLNLTFCGIDLIKQDDDYYLLEANVGPGYSTFEQAINNNKISTALFEVLNG